MADTFRKRIASYIKWYDFESLNIFVKLPNKFVLIVMLTEQILIWNLHGIHTEFSLLSFINVRNLWFSSYNNGYDIESLNIFV